MIALYNERVKPSETVVWCGDCFFSGGKAHHASIMKRLNGTKILTRGNHDRKPAEMVNLGFDFVTDRIYTVIAGHNCLINHYPYLGTTYGVLGEEDDRYPERRPKPDEKFVDVIIHGHVHSKERVLGNQIHVGVDAWSYRPVSIGEVEELIRRMG